MVSNQPFSYTLFPRSVRPRQGMRASRNVKWELQPFGRLGKCIRSKTSSIIVRAKTKQREWQEYEDALESRDLGRALEALQVLNTFESDSATLPDSVEDNGSLRAELLPEVLSETSTSGFVTISEGDCLKVLDACQSALDLQLVGKAYNWLQLRGLLPSFGKYNARVFAASEEGRVVTPVDMLASAGLEASNLSPKKWGLSGDSSIALVAGIALFSFLVNNNVDIRPLLALILGLGLLDAIYLGGTGQAQLLSLWPPYRRRVLIHEAGHVLVAYLLGCPVRGVVLDAVSAIKMGIQGQAGTQFWDETLDEELRQDRLTGASFDRYCIVLFAGIAAEGLVYGEAEGGENDENLYKGVVSQLRPPWGPGKMSNQARWAVLQAFSLLKEHQKVHEGLVQALEQGVGLGSLVKTIEESMATKR